MDLKSEKILIAGAGISGIGAAALLGKAGIAAAIYDGLSLIHICQKVRNRYGREADSKGSSCKEECEKTRTKKNGE